MRTIIAGLLFALSSAALASGVARAETEPLKPAPVPGISAGTVAPADRAGRSNTTDNSSPFAGAPASAIGQATPQTAATPQKEAAPTPSLSR